MWSNLRYHPVICLEELRKPTTHEFLSHNRRIPSADLSPGSPEFEAVLYAYKCQFGKEKNIDDYDIDDDKY